jgi:zinc transport system substrate-binding protein
MSIFTRITGFLFILILWILAGCSPQGSSAAISGEGVDIPGKESTQDAFTVTVSIPPQKYFLERIAGKRVNVNVMVPPGGNPHTYEPTPQQMKALSQSKAYFSIGVEFEKAWLERFQSANPGMHMVNTLENIAFTPIPAIPHNDGESGQPGSGDGMDTHIWTSPEMVKQIAQSIYTSLAEIDPQYEPVYRQNLADFLVEIEGLQKNIRQTLPTTGNRSFLVFHPAWGYFAQEFGLEQIPVEVGGQEPSPQELAGVIQQAAAKNIKVIFVQPSINPLTAQTIANEIGAKVLVIDPLAENWKDNLQRVAQTFAETMAR